MKVLIIHPYLGSHYKAIIFSALAKITREKDILSLKVLQIFAKEDSRKNMEEIDLSIHNYDFEILFEQSDSQVGFWTRLRKIFKYIKKENPSILNITGYYDLAVVLNAIWWKIKGNKLIISIDSTLEDNSSSFSANFIKTRILKSADGFFCYGTKSAALVQFFTGSDQKVLVKKNAVDNNFFKSEHNKYFQTEEFKLKREKLPKYNFLFVGRFIEQKNLAFLINTFKKITSQEWGLLLMGEGILKDKMIELSTMDSRINILPGQSWNKIPQTMALGDVFVLPSKSEPWGLVVNEAMACSMPVLVSNKCGSSVDLVENSVNGFTFDPQNENELLDQLMYFINNPEKIKAMGLKSSEKISSFSPESVALKMWDGFNALNT